MIASKITVATLDVWIVLTEEGILISDRPSIIRAASNGNADAVRAQLSEGADVDRRNRGGQTALMLAAIFGHVDIACLLLAAGADERLQDNLGLTAREWADRRGSSEVSKLLSNASPAEVVPFPTNTQGKQARPELEAERLSPAAEGTTRPQQDALSGTEVQLTTKADPQRREVEQERQASATETVAPQQDARRWIQNQLRIIADQERRAAEQERRASATETEIGSHEETPSGADELQKTKPDPQREAEDVPARLSERGADRGPQVGSPLGVVDATWSSTGATRREVEEARGASSIETHAPPQQDAPNAAEEHKRTKAELEQIKAEEARPPGTQSPRIADAEQLRILEESRQRIEAEGRVESQRATRAAMESGPRGVPREEAQGSQSSISAGVPYALGSHVDRNAGNTRLEGPPAELSTRPAMLEPKTSGSLNPQPIKRCPKCNTTYQNSLFVYCAYDATKLITDDTFLFNFSAASDWARQTLWALVAIMVVGGASIGYLINNYRSKEKVTSVPIAAQTEQPEIARKDLPVIDGELSGMEVNVPEPEYPAKARTEGVSGTVTVRVRVNKEGRVISARSSGRDWRLRAAAVKAAQKATFSADKLAGRGAIGAITYNFAAQTESPAATGSQGSTQPNPPSAEVSSSVTGSSAENVGGDYPVVGGALVGAESNLPQPDYPEKAKSKAISGTITVVVRVNRAGKVISWRTSQGDSQLRAAALKAAKKATFSPEKLPKGEVVGTITYNFKP
ncbi:MAG: TonB family protein [Pyrinomonadaceae bacterium]|nr:TonB family protein [Pyrinomonadaceae bacterium]